MQVRKGGDKGCYFIQGDWGKPIRGQQTETRRNTVVSCSEAGWGSPMQSPSSRRVLGVLAAGWLRAGVERARGRGGDEAGEISRAGGCRALQAGTRTLFFTLRKMGKPGGQSRAESKSPASGYYSKNRL